MANTKLNRTAGSTGNRKTWTWSGWVKRAAVPGTADSKGGLFATYTDTNNRLDFGVDSNHRFFFKEKESSSTVIDFTSTRLFRDPSAFYHFVIAVDTTDSTAADRVKVYVNGERITSWLDSTAPSQNRDTLMNVSGRTYIIGSTDGSSNYWNGVMSHVHFCDGTALASTVFGETDSTTGEWTINTSPSFTLGTNGFTVLKDGNTITDQSSNSNNFSLGGGTLTKTEDCPSNVFATLSAVYKNFNQPTFTQGNTTTSSASSGYFNAFSSIAVSTGKYYAEIKRGSSESQIGISSLNDAQTLFPQADYYIGETSKSLGISSGDGKYRIGTTGTTYGSSYTTGDIIGLALDLDNKKLYASKNGAWSNGSGTWDSTTFNASTGAIDISSIIPSGEYAYIGFSIGDPGTGFNANFGNGYFGTTAVSSAGTNASGIGIFEYDVPANFTALSTKGLNL